ncbi:sensor histidine kinase [Actinomadura roseirufa]|uniref:sensor histidine kinase n=1 Tax=Actinomadura roseirufa TaxID=2094049 RepID=UPI0010418F20|nr:HAMP domain-containing sensor histidine kinase [Actinomadura roseirufa]
MRRTRGRAPLRRSVLLANIGVAVLALLLADVPLAVTTQRLYRDEAIIRLERQANGMLGSDASARDAPSGLKVGFYGSGGRRFAGTGPSRSAVAAAARSGRAGDAVEDGQLVVSAPLPADRTLRVGTSYAAISHRAERAWALIGAAALLLLLVALLAARRVAALATRPLAQFGVAARRFGEGDFAAPVLDGGPREAHLAAAALADAGRRLSALFARERAFSADVAHQLRTPVTAVMLGLEAALHRPRADLATAVRTAVRRTRRLAVTIDDLLRLARDQQTRELIDVHRLVEDAWGRWLPRAASAGRRLTVRVPGRSPEVRAAPAALHQILDVLLDNALVHGAGEVVITVRERGLAVAVEVADHGTGPPGAVDVFARRPPGPYGGRHGIGLALARSLAEAEGGRLAAARHPPAAFTLFLPKAGAAANYGSAM